MSKLEAAFSVLSLARSADVGATLLQGWGFWGGHEAGRRLFSRILGTAIPYTGSINPVVVELERGRARVRLEDRRAVRNHLDSVHAIALANVGEFSTGLALLTGLPAGQRGILKQIRVEYLKKARGRLHAEARYAAADGVDLAARREEILRGEIFDEAGQMVSVVEATWVVGPARSGGGAR